MHRGKTLIKEIEREEKEKIEQDRPWKVPNYRSGDLVEVAMFQSLSEGKFSKYKGVILGQEKRKSLSKGFHLMMNVDDVNALQKIKVYSPLIAKVDIVKYGSNKNRNWLNQLASEDTPKQTLLEPVIKGRGYKARADSASGRRKRGGQDKERGKAKRESIRLEQPYEV